MITNARIALVPAALAGLLAAAGCSSTASPAASVNPSAPFFGGMGSAAPVSINGTLVDCGAGRQALVQQANGVAAVSCVGGSMTAFGASVEPPFASQPIGYVANAPTLTPAVYQEPVYRPRTVTRRAAPSGRSWKKSAAIIGGSTAAGAGVGAVLAGGGGAKKGAVIGLVGGAIYDIATRNR